MTRVGRLGRRAVLLGGGAELLRLAVGASLSACGGSTTGELVGFDAMVSSELAAGETFVNAHGWEVTLDRAELALGPLQLFEGDTDAAQAWLSPLSLPSAHAHPGHYDEGEVMGEVLEPAVVDLLGGDRVLARGRGIAGHVGSARLTFDADRADGWVVWLEGRARRGEERRVFRARASEPEVTSHHGEPEIWGCPFHGGRLDERAGTVLLTVRPTRWLEQVRFELHAEDGVDVATDLDPVLETHAAFVAGVLDPAAYVFTLA